MGAGVTQGDTVGRVLRVLALVTAALSVGFLVGMARPRSGPALAPHVTTPGPDPHTTVPTPSDDGPGASTVSSQHPPGAGR